ncbi:MAG: transcriptional regulator [Mycobacteriaceae bacterium]|nr:transcriptional regulator [Mycobacteriaceae bacterium]
MDDDAADPGLSRAGAAVAARRRELDIKQRELARLKVITASSLIDFEKGRSWPRERTRANLEELLRWPAGTIASIRNGGAIPGAEPDRTVRDGEVSLIIDAVDVAMNTFNTAIANLPDERDPKFVPHASAILTDMRQLDVITARAVRNSRGSPAVVKALAAVRRRYDELMSRLAAAPGATLGQRLYIARRRANLTAAEAAYALGVPIALITAVEGGGLAEPEVASRIDVLITELDTG